jgi:hypothetical protein
MRAESVVKRAPRLSLSSIPALMALSLSSSVALAKEPPVRTWGTTPAPAPSVAEPAPPPPLVMGDSAPATPTERTPDRIAGSPAQPRHMWGITMDLGIPDGAGLGLAMRPLDWLRLGGAVTHNGMAPGVRLGVTLDPLPSPVGVTFTVEGGHYWSGTIPGIQGLPPIAYNYANFHAGLEFGNRSGFRFFVHGGASWLDLSGATAQNATLATTLSNLSYRGWLTPSAKLGVSLYF